MPGEAYQRIAGLDLGRKDGVCLGGTGGTGARGWRMFAIGWAPGEGHRREGYSVVRTVDRGRRTGQTGLTRRPPGNREKILDEWVRDNDTSGPRSFLPGKELPVTALYAPERAICASGPGNGQPAASASNRQGGCS